MKCLILIFICCVCLSGCATSALWHPDNHEVKSVAEKNADGNKLYISNDMKTLCISYEELANNGKSNEMKYLIIEPGKNINTNTLNAIFNDPLNLRVNSINAVARHHKSIDGKNINYLLLDVVFNIPDESVLFKEIEDKPYPGFEYMTKTHGRLNNDLLKIVLKKQYNKILESPDTCPACDYFQPLSLIDKDEHVINSHDTDIDEERSKLLARIDFKQSVRSMIVNFDIRKYDAFKNGDVRPRAEADYNSGTATYKFGTNSGGLPGPLPMNSVTISDHASELDTRFTLLSDRNSTPIKLIFSETKEQYNPAKLSLQILGTPFSAAFDIVTSPIQLLFGVLWVNYGHI